MKPPTHLRSLRNRLAGLRHRRQRFRWATAASAMAIAVLWALAGVFALDWCFQRNVDIWQRLMLLVLAATGVFWAFFRFARPWLGKREDVTDMALLVQGHEGIDSDLVAAMQFESGDAARWGSTQLQSAVIDRVAVEEKKIDVMAALPRQPLARRRKVLVATLAAWILVAVLVPQTVLVFFQRLAFGPQHYPSQTRLVAVTVNGKPVDFAGTENSDVHVMCGQAVRFEVEIAGSQAPFSGNVGGRAEVSTEGSGRAANVPLEPQPGGDSSKYLGEFAKLSQPARYQVFVGDAWTDPLTLSVTPLPVVEIEVEVVPPEYARGANTAALKLPRGMRDFRVVAGSEVRLTLASDRPVKAAEVTIAGKSYAMRHEDAAANNQEIWTLAPAGTPLASVADKLSYIVQIHDAEGQTLDRPVEGSISIAPDEPPGIVATTKTPVVLPSGSPSIHYEAADDHALGAIWLTWEATAAEASPTGEGPAAAEVSPAAEKREGRIEICRFPPKSPPRSQEGDYSLALESLPLKAGDTLKVTFHASDYRGPAAAATTDAEPPLVFQVTDVRGFEESMMEADQKSAGALEDIRKKHSGQGDPQ